MKGIFILILLNIAAVGAIAQTKAKADSIRTEAAGVYLVKSSNSMYNSVIFSGVGTMCFALAPLTVKRDGNGIMTSEGYRPLFIGIGGACVLYGAIEGLRAVRFIRLSGKSLSVRANGSGVGLNYAF